MSKLFKVVVPKENVNDEVAIIVSWYVKSTTYVKKGDLIVEMENTKATFDINAECEGYLFYRLEPNQEIPVGSVIAYISEGINPPQEMELFEKKGAVTEKDSSFAIEGG